MNNERRKELRRVLSDLQQFVDGNVPETEALNALSEPKTEVSNCLFDEKESRDNILEVTPSGPKVDMADRHVYALEDAYDDLQSASQHLQDNDADYQGLIDVYIKSAIENIKKAIGR